MITISTCLRYPEPPALLQALKEALIAQGLATHFCPWQEPTPAGLILPLCAWDYSFEPERFARWIKSHAPFFLNPADLMLWNMQKTYLLDLLAQGVDVIPTEIAPADATQVQKILAKNRWQTAVIKPVIGQSGKQVQKIEPNKALDLSHYQGDVVVQPFIPEVASQGETSLVFFAGAFSHSVRRQPAKKEWRANSAYGVEILPAQPSQGIIRQAQAVLEKLPTMPPYARVDGTVIGERFLLNELELIEPALYLHTQAAALERFVALIKSHYKPANFG